MEYLKGFGMSFFNNENNQQQYVQQAQQIQRHEIARMQQLVTDLESHVQTLHQRATFIGQTLTTPEEAQQYSNLLLELNQTNASLQQHYNALSQMIQMANFDFSKTIPEQCRREIYHLYYAGRYTQSQLATHYQISQSAVSKIVNGQAPTPIEGVNPSGVASS